MKTAVVILNWNGSRYLQKFLPALIEHTQQPGVEIIVADNASTDDSLKVLEKKFPAVRVIGLDRNYGFAEGYNKALRQLQPDYFILLNSDVEVAPGWFEPLIEYMDSSNAAACQPKIKSYDKKDFFEYAGAAGGFIDKYGYPFCRGRILGTIEKDNGQYDDIEPVFWASGACLVIRSDKFREVNGFDSRFFAHMEEIDLCWRLKNRGYDIVCIPQSIVYHVGGGTLNAESPYKTYLNYRNNLLMLYKNLPADALGKTMFIRFFLDYLAALHLFLTGRFSNACKVFKARRDYKKMRRQYAEDKKNNTINSFNQYIGQILPKSIIYQYYVKRKKTYDKLVK